MNPHFHVCFILMMVIMTTLATNTTDSEKMSFFEDVTTERPIDLYDTVKEILGHKSITSGAEYFRANATGNLIELVPNKQEAEHWILKTRNGTIAFENYERRPQYMKCNQDKTVDFFGFLWTKGVFWTPFKNDDGKWAFECEHGGYLGTNGKRVIVSSDKHWFSIEQNNVVYPGVSDIIWTI